MKALLALWLALFCVSCTVKDQNPLGPSLETISGIRSNLENTASGTELLDPLAASGTSPITLPLSLPSFYVGPVLAAAGGQTLWQLTAANAAFSPRHAHQSVVFNNKLWVIGGVNSGNSRLNDVYFSSDGATWLLMPQIMPFNPARSQHTSLAYNGKMWVIAGYGFGGYASVFSSPDGSIWTQATANAAFGPRWGHSSVNYNGMMWVIGGYDGSGRRNDVWYSTNGVTWSRATANAAFSRRNEHWSVVHDGKMWVIGGFSGQLMKDVWYSTDGVNWVCTNANAPFAGRTGHSLVELNGKMWIIGGSSSQLMKDVWSSTDGATWTRDPDGDFSPRYFHSSASDFNQKMWVIGGYDGAARNDVWSWDGKQGALKILSPTNSSVYDTGVNIAFVGQKTGTVDQIEWESNLNHGFGFGLTASISTLLVGTHTITLKGVAGATPVSDSIQIGIRETLQKIEIKNLVTGGMTALGSDTFAVSYRAVKTAFQAIGYYPNKTASVAVEWALIEEPDFQIIDNNGVVKFPMREQIMTKLNSTPPPGFSNIPKKIGSLCDGNGDCSYNPSGQKVATFASFLSGIIKLKATHTASGKERVITIRIKQPTVYVDCKVVREGSTNLEILPDLAPKANEIFWQENLIKIKVRDAHFTDNFIFPVRLPMIESGEDLVQGLPPEEGGGKVDFHNTIVTDDLANNHFFASTTFFLVPSQSNELLKKDRSNLPTDINLYVTDFIYGIVLPESNIPYVFKDAAAASLLFDSGPGALNGFFQYEPAHQGIKSPINTQQEGGTVIRSKKSPEHDINEFNLALVTALAHELGHFILDAGDEHTIYVKNINNLMAEGAELEPEQFLAALDFEKHKQSTNFFLIEE